MNTIFECSYLYFGWEIGHPLSMCVARKIDEGHPKCLQMPTGGEGYRTSCVRTHLYYLFSCFCLMVSCFISTCVTGFVSFPFTVRWPTLKRSLFRFHCIWHCLLTRHWFVQYQQHLYIAVILQYNSGSMAVTLNKSPFQYVYFSLGYCIFTLF